MTVDIATKEDIKELKNLIDKQNQLLLKLMKANRMSEVVDVSDICAMKSISRTHLLNHRQYLMPNFGESEFPEGRRRWNLETYEKWDAIPIGERILMWQNKLKNERALVIGKKV